MSADRDGRPLLVDELVLDGARHRDQPVHVRGQGSQKLLVLGGADPARVDRRDQVRPPVADLGEGQDRPRGDGLRAVHVGVDDVRADLGQMGRQRADRDRVVGIVDDEHGDVGPLELADGPAARQGHDRDVIAARVDSGHERLEMLLGPTVGAGREHLDHPDPAGRQHRSVDRLETGIPWLRGGHVTWPAVGRARAGRARPPRPTRTCTARRRGGSRAGACPRRARARRRRGP